jgi:hypothetical protein
MGGEGEKRASGGSGGGTGEGISSPAATRRGSVKGVGGVDQWRMRGARWRASGLPKAASPEASRRVPFFPISILLRFELFGPLISPPQWAEPQKILLACGPTR